MIFGETSRDIAQLLREAIVRKEVLAGSVYSLDALVQELEVSPRVVEGAFRLLRDEGWIQIEANGSAVVKPMTHLSIAGASHL